jgi:hypothetical protein
MFRSAQTLRMRCAVCLKFPCTARDVLRSRGREFYETGTQRSQRWQILLKITETLWKNSLIIAKDV